MLTRYQQLIDQQQLTADPAQKNACAVLDHLAQQLNQGLTTESLYLYGPVGRGKSMLMDLFYDSLFINAKVRLHYHHFMRRVHQQLQLNEGETNPLQHIAAAWAQQYRVICLDEFMVEDIGDAMLLANLWSALFDAGVVLVTTSNTPPSELYRGGLARHRFEPFIDLLNRQCRIVAIDSGTDYRRLTAAETPYYLIGQSPTKLKSLCEQLSGPVSPTHQITVMNRPINTLWCNSAIVGFDFQELCSGPRSHRDYMELADRYRGIAVNAVPQFSLQPCAEAAQGIEEGYQRDQASVHLSHLDNEARRFIALVDECYDRKCLLVLTAAVDIDQLYRAELLKFPFQRCASRLFEMQNWQFVA